MGGNEWDAVERLQRWGGLPAWAWAAVGGAVAACVCVLAGVAALPG